MAELQCACFACKRSLAQSSTVSPVQKDQGVGEVTRLDVNIRLLYPESCSAFIFDWPVTLIMLCISFLF